MNEMSIARFFLAVWTVFWSLLMAVFLMAVIGFVGIGAVISIITLLSYL